MLGTLLSQQRRGSPIPSRQLEPILSLVLVTGLSESPRQFPSLGAGWEQAWGPQRTAQPLACWGVGLCAQGQLVSIQ